MESSGGARSWAVDGLRRVAWHGGGKLAFGASWTTGDVIGVAFGQAELPNLRFYKNGNEITKAEVQRVRGAVHPAVSVAGATELKCVFGEGHLKHAPPRGHGVLRVSQSLI